MAHASSIPGGFCCCLCGSIGWWLLAPCVPTLLSIMFGYQQGEISGSAIDTILIMPTMHSCNDAKWQESKLLLPIANSDVEWHWPLALLLTVPEVCYLLQKIVLQLSSWRKFNHFDPARNGWLFRPSFWVWTRSLWKGSPWAGENIRECSDIYENGVLFNLFVHIFSIFTLAIFFSKRWVTTISWWF